MDKIKAQANRVSQLVFSAETGAAYKRVLVLTWDILRETGVLLWLVVCLLFVGIEWFYFSSVKLGRQTRAWYENLGQTSEGAEPQSAASTGQAVLNAGQSGINYLLTQARQQLGMKAPEKPAPPKPAPASPPAPAPSSPAPSSPAPAPAAATPKPQDDDPKLTVDSPQSAIDLDEDEV